MPVRPKASPIRKVEYEVRMKNTVSSSGKSLILVNLATAAVSMPMNTPQANDPKKII